MFNAMLNRRYYCLVQHVIVGITVQGAIVQDKTYYPTITKSPTNTESFSRLMLCSIWLFFLALYKTKIEESKFLSDSFFAAVITLLHFTRLMIQRHEYFQFLFSMPCPVKRHNASALWLVSSGRRYSFQRKKR